MLEKLRKQMADIQARAKTIIESEERSDAAQANLDELLAEGETVKARIAELEKLDQLTAAGGQLDAILSGATRRRDESARPENLTGGEEFTRSEVFRNYGFSGSSSRVLIRALPMGITTPFGAVMPKVQVDNSAPNPVTPLTNLIPAIPVSQNSFDLVTFAKTTGGAAVVAEGANKPAVEFGPTATPVVLDTIAGYTQATRQLLEDSSAIAAMINQELAREVALKLESEAAAALVAATIPTGAAATLLASIRVGIGAVQAQGFNPNAVLLNPADWATLDIDVMGKTLIGPSLQSEFWGVRPVASNAQPAGTATVGDFSAGASRFTRTGINVYMTDSHASTFIANVFTILAEARAKTVVRRPNAFYEATKTP